MPNREQPVTDMTDRSVTEDGPVNIPDPRVACDHRAPAGRRLLSIHQTSAGTVAYARCACGKWLVLLDRQLLATVGAPVPAFCHTQGDRDD
jgi:hypothetical protein